MDQPRTYTTSRIASAVGIHPKHGAPHERIGFITGRLSALRTAIACSRTRICCRCTQAAALNVELVQNGLRREVLAIVETMASQRYDEAISLARQRIDHLRRERVVPPRMPCATCS